MGAFNAYTNSLIPDSEMTQGQKVPGYVPTFVIVGSGFMIAGGAFICLRVRIISIQRGQSSLKSGLAAQSSADDQIDPTSSRL